jgi:hypothetical protein
MSSVSVQRLIYITSGCPEGYAIAQQSQTMYDHRTTFAYIPGQLLKNGGLLPLKKPGTSAFLCAYSIPRARDLLHEYLRLQQEGTTCPTSPAMPRLLPPELQAPTR